MSGSPPNAVAPRGSEVAALFRLLSAAPPRSAEIVKRYTLGKQPLDALATLYAVTPENAQRVVLRALLDVDSGGTEHIKDSDEPTLAQAVLLGTPSTDALVVRLRSLIDRLNSNAEPLREELARAAEAFEKSPDRSRDDWLRRLAIIVVLLLTAYFYWRENNKPKFQQLELHRSGQKPSPGAQQ
ncbi:MAG: hypothetical protein JNM17_29055 [Archangium sp.]|nr:hypothetical protein [Archangium sp.]